MAVSPIGLTERAVNVGHKDVGDKDVGNKDVGNKGSVIPGGGPNVGRNIEILFQLETTLKGKTVAAETRKCKKA